MNAVKGLKKAAGILVSVILWIIILLAALYAFTTMATRNESEVASLMGYTPLVVESNSMSPTFNAGDMIVIQKCDTSELKEQDIICFHTIIQNEYALNTHRIVKIIEQNGARSYTTRGDNNAAEDTHIISDGDIVGRYVTRIPLLGHVMNFLSGSFGFFAVIVLPMFVFFIYQIYHLIMVAIQLKKASMQEEVEKKAAAIVAAEGSLPESAGIQQPANLQSAKGVPPVNAQGGQGVSPVNAQGMQQAAYPQTYPDMQTAQTSQTGEQMYQGYDMQTQQEPRRELSEVEKTRLEAEKALAQAKKLREEAEALQMRVKAETALAEARRLKEEAESMLKEVVVQKEEDEAHE